MNSITIRWENGEQKVQFAELPFPNYAAAHIAYDTVLAALFAEAIKAAPVGEDEAGK
jgi:hypothetical protein